MYTVSAVPISLKSLTSAMVRVWQIERVEPAGNNQASKQLIFNVNGTQQSRNRRCLESRIDAKSSGTGLHSQVSQCTSALLELSVQLRWCHFALDWRYLSHVPVG